MDKRYKRQSVNSNLFHHGLVRLLLVYHLKLQGDNWDTFLTRNVFAIVNPVEIPMIDKPMLEKPPVLSSIKPIPVCLESCVKATFDEPMSEQQDDDPRFIEFHEHE